MAGDETIVNGIWLRKIGERGWEIGENLRENGERHRKIGENGFYHVESRRENGDRPREIGEHDPRIGDDASAMGKIARDKVAAPKAARFGTKIPGSRVFTSRSNSF